MLIEERHIVVVVEKTSGVKLITVGLIKVLSIETIIIMVGVIYCIL